MQDMDFERTALARSTAASETALADAGPTALPTDAELRTAKRRSRRAQQREHETRIAYAALLGRPLAAFIVEHFPEVASLDLDSDWDEWSFTLRDASGAAYEPSPTANEAYDDLYDQCWEFTAALLPWGGERAFTLDALARGDLSGGWV